MRGRAAGACNARYRNQATSTRRTRRGEGQRVARVNHAGRRPPRLNAISAVLLRQSLAPASSSSASTSTRPPDGRPRLPTTAAASTRLAIAASARSRRSGDSPGGLPARDLPGDPPPAARILPCDHHRRRIQRQTVSTVPFEGALYVLYERVREGATRCVGRSASPLRRRHLHQVYQH